MDFFPVLSCFATNSPWECFHFFFDDITKEVCVVSIPHHVQWLILSHLSSSLDAFRETLVLAFFVTMLHAMISTKPFPRLASL